MIISFLYFMELSQGLESPSEFSRNKKIIVIDDPISSLSNTYVFHVAQQIIELYFEDQNKKFEQVFVLTHSLYFFIELKNYTKKKETKNFRVVRTG